MIKEELEKWAEQASDLYNKIGSEKNLSFYTQSPLDKLVDNQVEVMIIGINPGSEGDYKTMLTNKAWTHCNSKIEKMPTWHLLKGNHNWIESMNCSSWDLHINWPYFKGLMRYFSLIGERNILMDETKFVLTNMTFLNTKNKKDLSDDILPQTISHTVKLIEIIKPKMIVFLAGGDAFGYLNNLKGESKFQDLTSKYPIKKVKDSSIHVGSLCGIPCYGVRHPAYEAEEVFLQISTFLKCVFGLEIKDLPPCDYINEQCNEAVKYVEKAKVLKDRIKPVVSATGACSWIYQHEVLVIEQSTSWASNDGGLKQTAKIGNNNIAMDLTPVSNENKYYLSVFCRNKDNSAAAIILKRLLERVNVEFQPYFNNPNRHLVASFDFDDDETIIKTITETIQTLKNAICQLFNH